MADGQITARTLRESFSAGVALVQTRFWQYAGALFALTVMVVASGIPDILAVKHRLWALAGVTAWLAHAIVGTFSIGVYRSFWESLNGGPVRA